MSEDRDASGRERSLEKRVRKVWHLDPFRMSQRPDGRFSCELQKPVEDLTPEEARRVLQAMEPVLERLRARAGEG